MTKKHFEAIAATIKVNVESARESGSPQRLASVLELVEELSHTFQQINPRFDKDRFLKACGVK